MQTILSEGESSALRISEEVLDQCLEKGSRDNMTTCIVLMAGHKVGEGGGVMARRETREAATKAEEEKRAAEKN